MDANDTTVNCEGDRERFSIFYVEILEMSRDNVSSLCIGFYA